MYMVFYSLTIGALRSLVTVFFNLAPPRICVRRADLSGAPPPPATDAEKFGIGGGGGPPGGGGGGGGTGMF